MCVWETVCDIELSSCLCVCVSVCIYVCVNSGVVGNTKCM